MPSPHKLEDFKDEINKCSKCGLCMSVCPVYKLTGNDCAVSRGKFVMLKGVLNGDLHLNKNINKYLDLCLKCGKCKDFCPAGIDVCKIFETAKYQYMKNSVLGKLIFFLQSKYILGNIIKIFKRPQKVTTGRNCKKLKILYFKGCVNNIFQDKFLENLTNIEIIEKNFECCGLPFLSSGNLERFEEVKRHNLKMIECDFDYIYTNCASCESTLKQYVNAKFINTGELALLQDINFKFKKPIKVTFHKPCHLENDNFFYPLIQKCENVEYIKMDNYDDCCGFAGEFAIKNRKISLQISKQKAQNIVNTGADYIITTCPACILGLKQGLSTYKKYPKVISLTDFLSLAEKI